MRKVSRVSAMLATAAAISMVATPALAHDRGWGGWGGGWRHHDDGIDGGDVIAGLLILGGIAAIASAASNSAKQQPRDYPPPPPPRRDASVDAGYAGDDSRPEWRGGSNFNDAVNRCMDEIDRGKARVDSVDSVNRVDDGWRVEGRADGDRSFSCTTGRDGRIIAVSIDGHAI